jgi:type II secretory pathway pseudopilin PulG
VDFIVDNAVPLSAIFLGVIVLVALAVLALSGLRLWRRARAAQKRIEREGDALSAQAERLEAAMAAVPERQAELQGEIRSLQDRIAALQVLANSASEAVNTLRAPLRYFGG